MIADKKFVDRQLSDKEFAALIGVIASIVLIVIICTLDMQAIYKEVLATNIVLCFVVGMLGRERKIGFGASYIVSLLLSPLVGCVVALSSQRKK